MTVDDLLVRISRNYALLRRAVDAAGRAVAARPRDSFLTPGEDLAFSEFVDGVEVHYVVDVYRIDRDGTLWVSVEADAKLFRPLALKPTFTFRKLTDERAFAVR